MFLEQSEKQVALRKEIRAYFSKLRQTLHYLTITGMITFIYLGMVFILYWG